MVNYFTYFDTIRKTVLNYNKYILYLYITISAKRKKSNVFQTAEKRRTNGIPRE